METNELVTRALRVVEASRYCTMGTLDESGRPALRAMTNLRNDGLATFWFATSLASRKIAHLRRNPQASLYFADPAKVIGLTLQGSVDILEDAESKALFWMPTFRLFFPRGAGDPSYCILRFHTEQAIYSQDRVTTLLEL